MATRTKTKQPGGIVVLHARDCAISREKELAREEGREPKAKRCNCAPSYEAWISSRREKRKIRKRFSPAEHGEYALAAAQNQLTDWRVALRVGAVRSPSRQTLRVIGDEWIAKAEAGEILSRKRTPFKPATLRGYRKDLETYVYPELGYERLAEIRLDDVQALVDRLVGRGLSGQTVLNAIIPLRCIVRYARKRKGLTSNPTDGLEVPEGGQRRERAETPVGAAALLDPLDEEAKPIYATAFYAGLRRGELQALRASDVRGLDGDGVAAISVRRSWDAKAGDVDPKSKAGVRDVPVPETLRAILAAHVERTGRRGDDFLLGPYGSAPFVPNDISRRALRAWAVAAVGALLTRTRLPAELVPIALHECRHTYSSFLDAAGVSEARADRYMGHSNRTVSARYRHQLDGQLAEDAATLERYLSGAAAGKVVPLAATG
jgi:integrase